MSRFHMTDWEKWFGKCLLLCFSLEIGLLFLAAAVMPRIF